MKKLEAYREKRRFAETPEPEGREGRSDPTALRFVVQKHGATRLHYDLRLELDGVMKSWAVTEGPSLDPKVRRLAVETEDHPLDYAGFEGVIPEGQYGAGPMLVWDRGTWVSLDDDPTAALEKGEMKFRLSGEKLGGGWMLKKLPKEQKAWLLIKERDQAVSTEDVLKARPESVLTGRDLEQVLADDAAPVGRAAAMPKRLKPMLPSPVPVPPDGEEWLHEIKYDGYRTLAFVKDGGVRFITRNGIDWTERYTALAPSFEELDCADALIDGEVIVQDARGGSSLDLLTDALKEGRGEALIFYAFDLVHLDGRNLTAVPLTERKRRLKRLLGRRTETAQLQFSDHAEDDGRALFAQICRLGLEGVVSKKRASPYRQGRTTDWLKAKRYDIGRFRVVGYTTKAAKTHVASLILADEHGNALTFAGRAGSGLGNDLARSLFLRFQDELSAPAVEAPKIDNAFWVEPKLMAEIGYRGRTASGVLRQPAVISVDDPGPVEVAAPERVERLVTDRDLAAVRLTNPDREMFGSGTSKLDIALYYARIGDWMLPDLMERPVTLIRCPSEDQKDCFYQRHAFHGLPDGIARLKDQDGEEFLSVETARGFLGLIQFGVIEFHPWDCRIDNLDRPDRFTVDLDPGEGVGWRALQAAALGLRERLDALGFTPFVRLTGGKGLHLVVPLLRRQGWDAVKRFLKAFVEAAARDAPRTFMVSPLKSKRKGLIFLDVGRTGHGTSAVASYSLRARPEFTVAMPMGWDEIAAAREKPSYDRLTAVDRMEKIQRNPWEELETSRAAISRRARRDVGLKE